MTETDTDDAMAPLPDDVDLPETLTVTFPVEEALNGRPPSESSMDDATIQEFVDVTKNIERSRALRELARDLVDEDAITEAEGLLWIDQAEVYSLCSDCYHDKRAGAWTGSTQNPDYHELRQQKEQALREGRPCTDCLEARVKELKAAIAERVEIEYAVEGWDGVA